MISSTVLVLTLGYIGCILGGAIGTTAEEDTLAYCLLGNILGTMLGLLVGGTVSAVVIMAT